MLCHLQQNGLIACQSEYETVFWLLTRSAEYCVSMYIIYTYGVDFLFDVKGTTHLSMRRLNSLNNCCHNLNIISSEVKFVPLVGSVKFLPTV